MDEHGFIRAVHRRLPPSVYALKLAVRFVRGIPDCWYSSTGGDLWVEYKYRPRTPRRTFDPRVSAHQQRWMTDRLQEGRRIALVIGTPDGALVLTDGAWATKAQPPSTWLTTTEVALWIVHATCCTSTSPAPANR